MEVLQLINTFLSLKNISIVPVISNIDKFFEFNFFTFPKQDSISYDWLVKFSISQKVIVLFSPLLFSFVKSETKNNKRIWRK